MNSASRSSAVPASRTTTSSKAGRLPTFRLSHAVQAVEFTVKQGDRERLAVVLFETLNACFGDTATQGLNTLTLCQRHRQTLIEAACRKASRHSQRLLILEADDIRPPHAH